MHAAHKLLIIALLFGLLTLPASAQIYNWNTGQVIPGTEGITPGPGVNLGYWDTDSHNLRYADLAGGLDLQEAMFLHSWLDYARFNGANLTGADLGSATLANADLTGAMVVEAFLDYANITAAQLYSTASYQTRDLHGIGLSGNDLTGWDFAGQNLTNAEFVFATLDNTNLSQANLTNADFYGVTLTNANLQAVNATNASFAGAILTNTNLHGANATGASFSSATLSNADLHGATLTGASFNQATLTNMDLHGMNLTGTNFVLAKLTNTDLSGANLIGVSFGWADLTTANLSGATVAEADFSKGGFAGNFYGTGITAAQLYSTASHQTGDLHGIRLAYHDLTGWDFAGQNLAGAIFSDATLANADLSRADTRGMGLSVSELAPAITRNTILPDGHIAGLDLGAGGTLKVRDYDGGIAITVDSAFQMDPASTLKLILEEDTWGSTISFQNGIPVTPGGTLELTFAPGVNIAGQIGRTFDVFDWTGVSPTGAFIVSSPYGWDLTNLYMTGDVTLIAIPEPATAGLFALVALVLGRRRQRMWRLQH